MHMYPLPKFHFNSTCRSGVSWGEGGFTQLPPPPVGQGVGQKHLGRERVKCLHFEFNRVNKLQFCTETALLLKNSCGSLQLNWASKQFHIEL